MGARPGIGMAVAIVAAAGFLFSCGSNSTARNGAAPEKGATMAFSLNSSQWKEGDAIPQQFTCDGADVSPPLEWSGAPEGTRSFSLVTEDPDAPGGTFFHWLIYDLPAGAHGLPENVSPQKELSDGSRQGRNSFGRIGYGGPCPPRGPAHRYFFHLYALDKKLDLPPGASRDQLDRAMKGHVLAETKLMGRYQRR